MEQQREKWEFENDPEGEKREMVDLYMAKGFNKTDAEIVISTIAKCVIAVVLVVDGGCGCWWWVVVVGGGCGWWW
jgi:hypothetical protein